jgi:hypothetical protein
MFLLRVQNYGQRQRKSRFNRHLNYLPPAFAGGITGGFMVCYQVSVQYTFIHHKAVLVSTYIKKQTAKAFLVRSGLP